MNKMMLWAACWCVGVWTAGAASLLPPLPVLPTPSGPIVGATSVAPPPLPEPAPKEPQVTPVTIDEAWAVDGRTVEITLGADAPQPTELREFTLWPTQEIRRITATDDPRVWRLETDALIPDTMYRIRYRGGEEALFRTMRTERETNERYKGRHGDSF